jgi:hypothetical protein
MKRILLTMALLAPTLAFAADLPRAAAADMPVKTSPPAPPARICYVGVGAEAAEQSTNVSGNNLFVTNALAGNMTAAGGSVDATVGCIFGGANWQRAFIGGGYQNVTGANENGSVASRWHAVAEYDIGFELVQRIIAAVPLQNLVSGWPTFTAPSLPTNVSVAPGAPKQYLGGGLRAWGLSGQFFTAEGSSVAVAPELTTGFIWWTTDPKTGALNGGMLDIYVYAARPIRGFQIDGLGASPGGTPLRFHAGYDEGTLYGTGIRYAFPVL